MTPMYSYIGYNNGRLWSCPFKASGLWHGLSVSSYRFTWGLPAIYKCKCFIPRRSGHLPGKAPNNSWEFIKLYAIIHWTWWRTWQHSGKYDVWLEHSICHVHGYVSMSMQPFPHSSILPTPPWHESISWMSCQDRGHNRQACPGKACSPNQSRK